MSKLSEAVAAVKQQQAAPKKSKLAQAVEQAKAQQATRTPVVSAGSVYDEPIVRSMPSQRNENYQASAVKNGEHNTAFDRSGVSRDQYDAAVRENYAVRTAPKTRSGYYQLPSAVSSQAGYDAWKSTVRSAPGAIRADISAVDGNIAGIKSQQASLQQQAKQLTIQVASRAGSTQQMMEWTNQAAALNAKAAAMNNQIAQQEQQKALLQDELGWSQYFRWEDLRSASDFAELSQYQSTQDTSAPAQRANLFTGQYDNSDFGDIDYDYINRNETAVGRQTANAVTNLTALTGRDNAERRQMTDDEIALFNYLYAKDAQNGDTAHSNAWAYVDYLNSEAYLGANLSQRRGEAAAAQITEEQNPVIRTGAALMTGLAGGVRNAGKGIAQVLDSEVQPQSWRDYQQSALGEQLTGVSGVAYGVGSTVGNMLPAIAASAITGGAGAPAGVAAAVGGAVTAAGTGGNAYAQARREGYSEDQARTYGALVGASEAGLQYLLGGISKLGGVSSNKILAKVASIDNALARIAATGAVKIGSEVTEEELQNFLEPALRSIIFDEAYEAPTADELIETALITVLTTGLLESGEIAGAARTNNAKVGAAIRQGGDEAMQQVIDQALQGKESGAAYKLAQQLQQQMQSGTVKDADVGRLLALTTRAPSTIGEADGPPSPQSGEGFGSATETGANADLDLPSPKAILQTGDQLTDTAAMYGVEDQTRERVRRIAELTGREVAFYLPKDRAENGYIDNSTNTIYVNAWGNNPVAQVIGHELTHSLEQSGSYGRLAQLVQQRIESMGGDVQQLKEAKMDLYRRHGRSLSDVGAMQEVVAEFVETNLLTDEASIRAVVQQDKTIGQRIMSWINNLLAKFGNSDAQERQFLSRARDLYAAALRETAPSTTGFAGGSPSPVARSAGQESGAGFGSTTATVQTPVVQQQTASSSAVMGQNQSIDIDRDEYLQSLRESYAEGALSEEEYNGLFDDYYNGGGESQWSISEDYADDVQDWYDEGMPTGERFILGDTGAVLQGLGAIESDIYMNGDKVSTILQQHPEMTIEEIKRIPEILDDPVLVLKSKRGGPNSRVVIFGSVKATNGQPILSVLDLRPTENGFLLDDMQKVNSAYTKKNGAGFVQSSEIMYADEKRTIPLLRSIGLTIASRPLLRNGYIGSISYSGQKVNLQGLQFDDVVASEGGIFDDVPRIILPGGEDVQYSLSEDEPAPTIQLPGGETSVRENLNRRAQTYLARTERAMVARVAEALSVPASAQREYLQEIAAEISEEYLQTGRLSQETADRLFETAYQNGVVVEEEFYQEYKHIKDQLRGQRVTISETDRADIPDWESFRKSAFGTLNIANSDGIPVDMAYQELQDMAPALFPANITHPADQLMKMFEVGRSIQKVEKSLDEYYGSEAAEFKSWAHRDFDAAIYDAISEMNVLRRYVEDRRQQEVEQPQLSTMEEVTEAYQHLKDARRTYEKAAAKHLLTNHDNIQIGRLLKGELELEHLDPAKDNVRGITEVYEAKKEYEAWAKQIRDWNVARRAGLRSLADNYLTFANDWKDKSAGILYSRETMERNIRDIVNDPRMAEQIIAEYFTPVHKAQAEATKLKNRLRDRVRALELSTFSQRKAKRLAKQGVVSEAHAVQLIGEAMDNIEMLERSRGMMKERDGKTLEDWRGIVQNLWANNPQLDQKKIYNAIEEFRQIYDELFQAMNESRVRNGYEPINYRKGYFPHFQEGESGGILALFGKSLGISTDVQNLPTTINGLTHTFRPGIQWVSSAQERKGFATAYDAVEGFDRYIEGVADVIYQTDNIQKLRALATQIRYRTGDEGIRKQVDAVLEDPTLSEQDKQNRIEKIYESGRYALSNFVVELEEYTNLLANKKSRADRNMEQAIGRRGYNIIKGLESRVAANMVAVNPASWLTNFIPLTQGGAQLDRGQLLRGMWQTLQSIKESDGIVDASAFLTNRQGSDPVVQTWARQASNVLSKPMDYIDSFTAGSLVRARYNQNLKRGLSEAEAMTEADNWTASVMADRSKGATPTLFNRSNPLTKVFTQFQLEVNNQLSYVFKDMPREQQEKGKLALAKALLKFALGAWLYDEVYEYFIGRRPALDPIGILNDTVGDITGYELPNLVSLGAGLVGLGEMPSFEAERVGAYDASMNLLNNVADNLPFMAAVGALGIDETLGLDIDAGRISLESAIPSVGQITKAATHETWSGRKKAREITDELIKPAAYFALPFGGGQIKKIYQGLRAVVEGGSYSVDDEGNDLLQYPVYTDGVVDTALSAAGAAIFGKSSLPTGRDWIESGFKTFGKNETAAYQAMTDADIDGRDAFELLLELRGAEKTEEKSKETVKREILRDSGVSGDGKSIVYYMTMASDKERELMDELAEREADMGEVAAALMDARDVTGEKAKRSVILDSALTQEDKALTLGKLFGEEETSESGNLTSYGRMNAALDAGATMSQWSEMEELGAADTFLEFAGAGLDPDDAYDMTSAIKALQPSGGRKTVSSAQKWMVVADQGMNVADQLAALRVVSTDAQYQKFEIANDFDVRPEAYVRVYDMLDEFDADGNGRYKNAEIEEALDSISPGMLPGNGSVALINDQKAVLWQLLTGSSSAKNNPYNAEIGAEVLAAIEAGR